MDIIKRNFLRTLRSGAFNDIEPFEPMSVFKWNKLLTMIVSQNVVPVAIKGMKNCQYENIPYTTILTFFKSCNIDITETIKEKVCIPQSGLNNRFLNKRLNELRYKERHSIDTSVETLDLLNIIIYNTNKILTHGITYDNLLIIGKYLRNKGNKVDFVKLEQWLQTIKLQSIAQYEGSILIATLNFDQKEIPFVHTIDNIAKNRALDALNNVIQQDPNHVHEWHFRQSKSGFLHNNSTLLRNNIWHSMKYINYAPLETVSNLINRIANSLSEIEE